MLTTEIITDQHIWNTALRALPGAHILQTWEWGEFKQATTGWKPHRLAFRRNGEIVALASVGIRQIGPFQVMYAPKGPAMQYKDPALVGEVLTQLQNLARRHFAVWLKIDPDVVAYFDEPGSVDETTYLPGQQIIEHLRKTGWRFSNDQIQFRNTILIDLLPDEETILAAMSQNTRRKIRVADKKGVTAREGAPGDLQTLYDLYKVTGQRDEFLIRPFEYYRLAWEKFMEAGLAHALIAEYEGRAIAHVILFHFGEKCWYFYGASADEERHRMPNYALQWEAIKWAKRRGYATYDLWGAPDQFNENDRMWGVYRFKRGFRGQLVRHIGAWDYAPYPILYHAYTRAMPKILSWMRRAG